MKKTCKLVSLIFTVFISTSTLAEQGTCVINLVNEDGNFAPSDYGPGGLVSYNITMPFTDGYYPNPDTESGSQHKPRGLFRNCITYQGAPSNATISSVSYSYTFQQAVLVADYQIMMAFFGSQNKFTYPLKRGGGNLNGANIPLSGNGVNNSVRGQLLSATELELRARVTNPEENGNCPSEIQRDQCNTRNSRLTKFTVNIDWSTPSSITTPFDLDVGSSHPHYNARIQCVPQVVWWTSHSEADYYKVYHNTNINAPDNEWTEMYQGLPNGTTYLDHFMSIPVREGGYLAVKACNTGGCGPMYKSNFNLLPHLPHCRIR